MSKPRSATRTAPGQPVQAGSAAKAGTPACSAVGAGAHATAAQAAVQAAVKAAARKAVVLGRMSARGGKVYQVLAPVAAPRHLSDDDIERAVAAMLAAR
jgi:hypothetical protein